MSMKDGRALTIEESTAEALDLVNAFNNVSKTDVSDCFVHFRYPTGYTSKGLKIPLAWARVGTHNPTAQIGDTWTDGFGAVVTIMHASAYESTPVGNGL
jgi:hypothetical protein